MSKKANYSQLFENWIAGNVKPIGNHKIYIVLKDVAKMTSKKEQLLTLFEAGYSRKDAAAILGVGYGHAQNVYADAYGVSRKNNRVGADIE